MCSILYIIELVKFQSILFFLYMFANIFLWRAFLKQKRRGVKYKQEKRAPTHIDERDF